MPAPIVVYPVTNCSSYVTNEFTFGHFVFYVWTRKVHGKNYQGKTDDIDSICKSQRRYEVVRKSQLFIYRTKSYLAVISNAGYSRKIVEKICLEEYVNNCHEYLLPKFAKIQCAERSVRIRL